MSSKIFLMCAFFNIFFCFTNSTFRSQVNFYDAIKAWFLNETIRSFLEFRVDMNLNSNQNLILYVLTAAEIKHIDHYGITRDHMGLRPSSGKAPFWPPGPSEPHTKQKKRGY